MSDRIYNERYSRRIAIQRGDLSRIQMALSVADDYLLWLVDLRGVRVGSVDGIRQTVGEARRLSLDLSNSPDLPRADADALAAVPELKDKKAVVLYFASEADRDELVALLHEAKPGMRAVNL